MSRLEPALEFHIKHAADIELLDGCESAPKGVLDVEWTRYQEVRGLAGQQVAGLLRRCRDEGAVRLEKARVIKRRGTGAQDGSVAENWDTWIAFTFVRKGPKSARGDGLIGVYFCSNPPSLVPYVNLYDAELGAVLAKKLTEVADGQKQMGDPEYRAVANIPVAADSDPDVLAREVADAFARVAADLGTVLQKRL